MVTIEQWIKRKLAASVASGSGQWAEASDSVFGKSIYQVTRGRVTLVLSELGFRYDSPTSSMEHRYDEIASVKFAPLVEIMRARGDLDKMINIGIILRGRSQNLEMKWPLIIYSNVATVFGRIVKELA